ncbi:MAG: hypothetical protein QOJ92_1297 [Frankiales bacterium]|nr:hypothetical protein [Frankiales bacterium]
MSEPDLDAVAPRPPLVRVRKHLVAVFLLEVALIAMSLSHAGFWYDNRPLMAVAFLQGALAAPWTISTPFLVAHDRPAAAVLVVLLGAPFNVWLRYLGYKHGLAEGKESQTWRAGGRKPWRDD